MHKPKVVIIIPTYNEAGNIKNTTKALAQIFRQCPSFDLHILFVDDNSPDGTGKVVENLIKQYPFVHLYSNKHKGGLGHAYKKGFVYALDKLRADILFEFDADLQHDPSVIPLMLKSIESGADLVLGSRYMQGGGIPESWPLYRKFLSIVGNLFIRLVMLRLTIRDWTTGYRALTSRLVKDIVPQMNNIAFSGYTWQIGFLVKAIQSGYIVREVPFVFRDRTNGFSKLGPEYIINTLRYIMKLRLQQLLHSRILKFVMVGGFGSLVQLVSLHFYRIFVGHDLWLFTAYQLALVLAIETAIISNFTWSNLWTFRDRKLTAFQIPVKFLQFNIASAGSILIQFVIASIGERAIGLFIIFSATLGSLAISLDTGIIYAVVGILVGMFWNFFAYSHFVWKKK